MRSSSACAAIPGTLSQAQGLGEAVLSANAAHANPIDMICTREGGKRLFEGKIIDLQRRLEGGFARGEITLEGFGANAGDTADIAIQNEFLLFRRNGVVAQRRFSLPHCFLADPHLFRARSFLHQA